MVAELGVRKCALLTQTHGLAEQRGSPYTYYSWELTLSINEINLLACSGPADLALMGIDGAFDARNARHLLMLRTHTQDARNDELASASYEL